MKDFKSVSQSLGKSLNFGSFSGKQAIWLVGVFVVTFFVISGIFGVSLFNGLFISSWAGLTCGFLSGAKPYKFWSKIYPTVPYWVKAQARYTSPVAKDKLGTKKV